jgi:hypothetical protein
MGGRRSSRGGDGHTDEFVIEDRRAGRVHGGVWPDPSWPNCVTAPVHAPPTFSVLVSRLPLKS